jgi:hypothetical protein
MGRMESGKDWSGRRGDKSVGPGKLHHMLQLLDNMAYHHAMTTDDTITQYCNN